MIFGTTIRSRALIFAISNAHDQSWNAGYSMARQKLCYAIWLAENVWIRRSDRRLLSGNARSVIIKGSWPCPVHRIINHIIAVSFGQYRNINPEPRYKNSQARFGTAGFGFIFSGIALGNSYHSLVNIRPDRSEANFSQNMMLAHRTRLPNVENISSNINV